MSADLRPNSSAPAPYDKALFADLLRRFKAGHLRAAPKGAICYAARSDIPHQSTDTQHADRGHSAIAAGEVGAVILAGGLATRFGGQPKAEVELKPGWSLLRIKLQTLETIAVAHDVVLDVIVIASFATEAAVRAILQKDPMKHLRIAVLLQSALPRIDESGDLVRDGNGDLSLNPPGHGEVLRLLSRHAWRGPGQPDFWQISNIDNLLATLDASVVGIHVNGAAAATVEVTQGSANDVGGYIALGPSGFEVIEGFQVTPQDRPRGEFFFSTNTFIVGKDAADAGQKLPFHEIRKTLPEGPVAIQFEQLLGDIGRLVPLNAVLVPREGQNSRFAPLKRVEDLDHSRDFLVAALDATGLLPW